jgi:predicted DNA-binding ribbon-helix-helix protein
VKSLIVKRSVVIGGHKTSVSVEEAFWKALKEIAVVQSVSLSELVTGIDSRREHGNLSSAIRLFVLNVYREELELHGGRQRAIQRAIGRSQTGYS